MSISEFGEYKKQQNFSLNLLTFFLIRFGAGYIAAFANLVQIVIPFFFISEVAGILIDFLDQDMHGIHHEGQSPLIGAFLCQQKQRFIQ